MYCRTLACLCAFADVVLLCGDDAPRCGVPEWLGCPIPVVPHALVRWSGMAVPSEGELSERAERLAQLRSGATCSRS
jgi:hypothetical protein